ncbi:hypothetical protein F383_27755 [Gossypium arboreum]|uniref:Uncharacterized protein n=1 Tax=Gossypium arboreum TaxID=29729 RepID=A0A0B0MNQ5_GOSAR|nr:hypothetical protein F383_27755 [Gossypium arboreum]
MPTSQIWCYMLSHIDAIVPDRVLHESNISMPTSQMWFSTRTHIGNPMS